jgi:hypothetical protein
VEPAGAPPPDVVVKVPPPPAVEVFTRPKPPEPPDVGTGVDITVANGE